MLHNISTEALTPYWDMPARVMLSITMIIMMIMAILGNLLVLIVIIRTHWMQTRTNMFLGNLAVTDCLCGCIDMPFSLVTVIRGEWIYSDNVCQMNGFATPFFFVASIHTLMYIAIFKYISIRNPFSSALTTCRIAIMIAAAWLWAAIMGYLSIHGLVHSEFQPYTTQCGPHYNKEPKYYAYFSILLLTCYVVPLVVIALCYIGMFYEIRSHGQRLRLHSTVDKEKIYKQQKHIMLTLFLVVLVFIITWTPWVVYSFVALIGEVDSHMANPVTFWFGYLNSACNPVIYALRSKSFRKGYKDALVRGPSNRGFQGRSFVGSYLPHNHNSASTQSSFVLRNSSSVKSAVVHEVHKLRLSTSSLFEEMVEIDKENEMEEIKVLKENDGSKTETETSEIQKCPDEIQPGLTKKKKKERRHHEANQPINDDRLEYTERRSQIITEQNEKSSKTKKHPDYPRTEDNSLPSDSAKEKYSSQLSNEEGQNYSKKIKPRTSKQSRLPETNMLPVDSTEQNENLPVRKKKREKYPQQNNEENETFLGEAAIEEKGGQKRKKISNRNDNFEADIEVRPSETREMVNDQEILPDEKKVETSTKRKKKLVEPDINVISSRTSDRVNNPKIPSPDDRQDTNFQKRKSTKSRSLHETGV